MIRFLKTLKQSNIFNNNNQSTIMKKIFLALAVLASVSMAYAQDQVKGFDAAKAAVAAAQEAANNPKKAAKAATWVKLGQTLMDAYNAPAGNAWVGASAQELALVSKERPISQENVVIGGVNMVKQVFATKNYYVNESGVLSLIEVTKPVVENALSQALEAYKKAYELDPKTAKTVLPAIQSISQKYIDEAYNAYNFQKFADASDLFEKAFDASNTAPYSVLDTNTLFNAAFTAHAAEDWNRAKSLFERCVDLGYYGEGGETYAKLANIAEKLGDKEAQKSYLEKGFAAAPEGQSILVGLINFYIDNNEDTGKLFELLDLAKNNEPNNASLYYVEGNIRLKLGDTENAAKAYEKCAEINPSYEYGYIGEGIMFYDKAADIQEAAQNEFDDAKYLALVADFEKSLKACIEPFEKAFELTQDDAVKVGIAEYLKNACFRFRETDEALLEKYNKYNDFVAAAAN